MAIPERMFRVEIIRDDHVSDRSELSVEDGHLKRGVGTFIDGHESHLRVSQANVDISVC